MQHNLQRQTEYLRSALQQDRRPLALLLGAGAPMAVRPSGLPIIPDVVGLTAAVRGEVPDPHRHTINKCLDDLPEKGGKPATVEHLLDYLRRLSAIPGNEPIRGLTHAQINEADAAVCSVIRSKLDVELPDAGTPYHDLALWSRAAVRHAPLEVYTTNYDLLLEQALEACDVPYFDGFAGSHRPSFDVHAVEEEQLPNRWVRLWKIHGSVSWSMAPDGAVRRCSSTDPAERTMIYPSHLKYDQSRRLPYLALLDRLRTFLRQPGAALVSCGFAFRDEHINELIAQALRSNPTAAVLALQYDPLASYEEGILVAKATPNLSILARDGAVIGSRDGTWEDGLDFDLGDFGRFGPLLREIMGHGNSPATAAGASSA